MLVTTMLILGVFGFVYNYTFSDDLNLSKPKLILDTRCFSKIDTPFFVSNTLRQKEIYYKNSSETKKKSKIKMFIKDLELIFEPSFGYSINNPTICSIYGKDLGTFKEHFGNVPILGYSIKIFKNNGGISIGSYYQRSNQSYFGIYKANECSINYTLLEIIIQYFHKFNITDKLILVISLGLNSPSVRFKSLDVDPYEGTTIDFFDFRLDKRYIAFSVQIVYKINKNTGIFVLYNPYGYYGKDNLSFGLSFKIF
jgi:hypothetical protein